MLVLSGCAGSQTRADESPRTPPLVRVNDQVWVVADRPRPIFFCSGSYWLYARDGAWFQSNEFEGDFAAVATYSVPQPLRDLPEPSRFAYAVGSVVNGEPGYVASQVVASESRSVLSAGPERLAARIEERVALYRRG